MDRFRFAVSSAAEAPDSAPILLRGGVVQNLKAAAALGYRAIEVHLRETEQLDYAAIAAAMAETGVGVSALATGRLNTEGGVDLMDDRPYITAAAMEGMGRYIDMAARLSADVIVGWVRGGVPPGKAAAPYHGRLAENLSRLCAAAARQGVRVCVEAINRYELNTFNTAAQLLDFIRRYRIPNCLVHLDTFHMGIEENDPCAAIRQCGDLLGYFHAADHTRWYPGAAGMEFGKLFSALEEIGYGGYVAVECLPKPDAQTAAERALAHLRAL